MPDERTVIAIFTNPADAEETRTTLAEAGIFAEVEASTGAGFRLPLGARLTVATGDARRAREVLGMPPDLDVPVRHGPSPVITIAFGVILFVLASLIVVTLVDLLVGR